MQIEDRSIADCCRFAIAELANAVSIARSAESPINHQSPDRESTTIADRPICNLRFVFASTILGRMMTR
jgi:hypothetical protein